MDNAQCEEMLADYILGQTHQKTLHDDSLLGCLEILCLQEHLSFSPKAITAGLPLENNKLTPSLFERAAARAGFESKIVKRDIAEISNLVLPAVLILDNNQSCVLNHIHDESKVEIILPETAKTPKYIEMSELKQFYTGYAIYVQATRPFEKRAEQFHTVVTKSWFWSTLWRFKKIYVQSFVCSLLINLFVLASPLFIMNVYDRVVPNYAFETLWVLAVGVSVVFIFDFIIRTSRAYLLDISGQKIDILIASKIFARVLGMKLKEKPQSSGAFANNIKEFDSLREFFTSATLATLVDIPFILIFITIMAYLGGTLALIPILIAPVIMIAAYCLERPMRGAIEEARLGASQKQALLVESIGSLEQIKSLSAESIMQKRWERYVAKTAKAGLQSRFFSSLAVNLTYFAQQMTTVLIVLSGVYMIEQGTLSVGGLIACVILSGRALAPLAQATNLLTRLEGSKMALAGLNQIMNLPLERDPQKQYLHRDTFRGDITFDDVSFNYPNQSIQSLQHISFKINAGERVAIIGRIGSGKSTLLKLILGLYEPTSGSIRIDGIELSQIDPAELRACIGYAGQDNILFYGNVRENIAMRDTLCNDGRILQVSKIVGVDDFVSSNPKGYDMNVGERGDNISGGQRQAINIARALLPNISILLLDEPTSAIDQKAEQQFVESMKKHLTNETLLLSTHRGAMMDLVDRIIYIDNGKIIADGNKDEILKAHDRRKQHVA